MKLTPDYIASQVLTCQFDYDGTHTTCTITTKHGSKHVGTSGCLDPANYNKEVGEQIAHKNALDKLWELEGYFISKLGLGQIPGQLMDADEVHLYTDEGYPLNGWSHHSQATVRVVTKTAEKPKENPYLNDAMRQHMENIAAPNGNQELKRIHEELHRAPSDAVIEAFLGNMPFATGGYVGLDLARKQLEELLLPPEEVINVPSSLDTTLNLVHAGIPADLASNANFQRDVVKVIMANKKRLGVV